MVDLYQRGRLNELLPSYSLEKCRRNGMSQILPAHLDNNLYNPSLSDIQRMSDQLLQNLIHSKSGSMSSDENDTTARKQNE